MGYKQKIENEIERKNYMAHIQGQYFAQAIMATVGNMFGGRSSNHKYPEKPYDLHPNRELTEKEKDAYRNSFVKSLEAMQASFEKNKKAQGGSN